MMLIEKIRVEGVIEGRQELQNAQSQFEPALPKRGRVPLCQLIQHGLRMIDAKDMRGARAQGRKQLIERTGSEPREALAQLVLPARAIRGDRLGYTK